MKRKGAELDGKSVSRGHSATISRVGERLFPKTYTLRITHLFTTPTKRTYGILRGFHGAISSGRGTIGDRITVKWEIGSTLVHHVTLANTWLSINLSTHKGGESKVLSVLAALKALDGASPIHVDGFFDKQ